jgi:hypothetical protein
MAREPVMIVVVDMAEDVGVGTPVVAHDGGFHPAAAASSAVVGHVIKVVGGDRYQVQMGGEPPPRADEVLREIVSR